MRVTCKFQLLNGPSIEVCTVTVQLLNLYLEHRRRKQSACLIYLGPVLISSSVIKDPQTLLIKATYNGATVQGGHIKSVSYIRILAKIRD